LTLRIPSGIFPPVGKVRFLVVDSDPATQEASLALTGRGHEASTALGAREAVEQALKRSPDVILVAPDLPGLDLSGFVRELRTTPVTALTPLIFLGAKAQIEPSLQGFQLGADDFLPKPIQSSELELRLEVCKRLKERAETALRPRSDAVEFSSAALLTAFKGSLDQIGLPSIFSLIDMERKTGMLVVILDPDREKFRVFFKEGRVMRAAFDKKDRPKNAELIYAVLSRNRGRFEFRNAEVDGQDEIQSPIARLLLEGARLMDESRR
jgi:CheY-like chemotaxis protein